MKNENKKYGKGMAFMGNSEAYFSFQSLLKDKKQNCLVFVVIHATETALEFLTLQSAPNFGQVCTAFYGVGRVVNIGSGFGTDSSAANDTQNRICSDGTLKNLVSAG